MVLVAHLGYKEIKNLLPGVRTPINLTGESHILKVTLIQNGKSKSSELLLSSQAKYIHGSTEDRKIAHETINEIEEIAPQPRIHSTRCPTQRNAA